MSTFIQMHLLTNYGPANLNRDDLGRPKTVIVGGAERLRVSSQCLKRAWRVSDLFQEALADHLGLRTKAMGVKAYEALTGGHALEDLLRGAGQGGRQSIGEKAAMATAEAVTAVFGAPKKKAADRPLQHLETEQLVHFSTQEITAVSDLVEACRESGKAPDKEQLALLRKNSAAVDIAMFGRMLASQPSYNAEAAVQVAHAFTVHRAAVQDDFFTAVDDLNRHEEDAGAGHMGVVEFGAGLFYQYVCVNRDLLVRNLDGNEELAARALRALATAAVQIAPGGKQASFASRAWASFALAEKGPEQPRALSAAFLKPVTGEDMLTEAVESLQRVRQNMNQTYAMDPACVWFNAHAGQGSLKDVLDFVAG